MNRSMAEILSAKKKCPSCGKVMTNNAGSLECENPVCPSVVALKKEIAETEREREKSAAGPLCTNCQKKISETFQKEFCSDVCFVAWMNQLRLLFPTEVPTDLELAKIYANQAILRLVKDRSVEENMAICEILTSAVVQLTLTILPQKAKKEIEERLENQKKRAALIKETVAETGSKKVADAQRERVKQELAKTGMKISHDGKCRYCKKESVGEFCSDLHKANYKSAEMFQRSMKLDLEAAIQFVKSMGDE